MTLLAIIFVSLFLIAAIGLFAQNPESIEWKQKTDSDIDIVDSMLPQTQCGDCGFSGCRPYAAAIIQGNADINRCIPGGMSTVNMLSDLTGMEVKPLYIQRNKSAVDALAVIDEAVCIGCVKCIKACPVDAIIGAPKVMHSVIDKYCTGCELCLPPCPVDCISMVYTKSS